MNPNRYARCCAVAEVFDVLAFAAPSLVAAEDSTAVLPSLFATPPSVTPAAIGKASTETNARSHGAGSERMRKQITAKILDSVCALPVKPVTVAAPEELNGSQPVMMERYVINAPPIRQVEIPVPPNRFLEAVKTGKLLSYPRGSGATEVLMRGKPIGAATPASSWASDFRGERPGDVPGRSRFRPRRYFALSASAQRMPFVSRVWNCGKSKSFGCPSEV